jgi:hypothetical protein
VRRTSEAGASLAVSSVGAGKTGASLAVSSVGTGKTGASLAVSSVGAGKTGASLTVASLAVAGLAVGAVATRVESTLTLGNEAGAGATSVRRAGKTGTSVRRTGKTGTGVRRASKASAGVGRTGQAGGTTSVAGNASVSTAGRVEELTSAGVVAVAEVVSVVGSAVVELVTLLGVGTGEARGLEVVGTVAGATSQTRASRAMLVGVRARVKSTLALGDKASAGVRAGVGRASQTGTVVTGEATVVVVAVVTLLLEAGTGEVVRDTIVASATSGDV